MQIIAELKAKARVTLHRYNTEAFNALSYEI